METKIMSYYELILHQENFRPLALFDLTCKLYAIATNAEKYLLLDVKTTGQDYCGEIIDIALIDLAANVVLNSQIEPVENELEVTSEHAIKLSDLIQSAPTFDQLAPEFESAIVGKTLILADDRIIDCFTESITASNYTAHLSFNYLYLNEYVAVFSGEIEKNHVDGVCYQQQPKRHTASAIGDAQTNLTQLWEMIKTLDPLHLLQSPYFSLANPPKGDDPIKAVWNQQNRFDSEF
jgi:hypothetical protein